MTAIAPVDIEHATAADVPVISRVLAEAFHDDPVLSWTVRDPERRRACLPGLFRVFSECYWPHGETYLAGDAGAALWAPPGCDPLAGDHAEAAVAELADLLGDDAERALQMDALFTAHRPEQACFHLQFVGVATAHRGLGLGGKLLTTVLERCDRSAAPAYLEATSPDNRRLYARHGFEVVTELTLPDGPPVWTMWREPEAARS